MDTILMHIATFVVVSIIIFCVVAEVITRMRSTRDEMVAMLSHIRHEIMLLRAAIESRERAGTDNVAFFDRRSTDRRSSVS